MVIAGILTTLMNIVDDFFTEQGYTTHIVSDELDEDSIDSLPYIYVFAADAPSIQKVATDIVRFTRNFFIEIYVEKETRADIEDRTVDVTTRDLSELLILELWKSSPNLKRKGLGTDNVEGLRITGDSGVGRGFLNKSSYVGTRLELQIIYTRSL